MIQADNHSAIYGHKHIQEANPKKTEIQEEEEWTHAKIWKVARDVFISSFFFWYVSQPLFMGGIAFGAVFYKENDEFANNLAFAWKKYGGFKSTIALVFAVAAFPGMIKFGAVLWGAHVAAEEVCVLKKLELSERLKDAGGNA